MLEHWYFSASLGLPPQTAATFLDVVTALGEPIGNERSEELVSSAVECLGQASTGTKLYGLPHVLAAQRRFAGVTEVNARAAALYRGIASVAPERLRARIGAALRAAGGSETHKALASLRDLLPDAGDGAIEASASVPPYHDIVEQLAPTVALIVARFLAGHDQQGVGQLLAQYPTVMDAALSGRHGRYALLQAAELSALLRPGGAESALTALARASLGAFDMEPDLLATAARVTFVLSGEGPRTDRVATVAALEREALTGQLLLHRLDRWRADGTLPKELDNDARLLAYLRLGGVGRLRDSAMPSVLWQTALWSLAAEQAPSETIRRLALWWQTPQGPPRRDGEPTRRSAEPERLPVTLPYASYDAVQLHAHRLLTLRHPSNPRPRLLFEQGSVETNPPTTAALLWSPWLVPPAPASPGKQSPVKQSAGKQRAGKQEEEKQEPQEHEAGKQEPQEQEPREQEAGKQEPGKQRARKQRGRKKRAAQPAPAPPVLRDNQPEQLVRLLGAGLIAAALLGSTAHRDEGSGATGGAGRQPDHLLLLIIHLRDCLGRVFKPVMTALGEDMKLAAEYAGHLCSLIVHAQNMVDRVGKGQRPPVHPSEIVRVVSSLPVQQPDGTYAPLPEWGARGVALQWVLESSAGGTGPHRTEAGGRWFAGDPPPADRLLSLIIEREPSAYTFNAVRAAQLSRILHKHRRGTVLRWDWSAEDGLRFPEEVTRGRAPELNPAALVLSGPLDTSRDAFSVEEWDDMAAGLGRLLAERDTRTIAPVTLDTLRLAALLDRPDLGDQGAHENWVSGWSGHITSLNSAAHLPRYVRARMFDMFDSPAAGPGSQERLLKVLEHVVDVIVDLSGGAQLFYDLLFEALSVQALPAEMANRLRVRALKSLYGKWEGNPPVVVGDNPFATLTSRVSGRGTEAALVRLLRATASVALQGEGKPLAEALSGLWTSTQQPVPYAAKPEVTGQVTADPRFVVATTVDRRTGWTVVHSRDESPDVAVQGAGHLYVRDAFRAAPAAEDPAAGTLVLGVVCSAPRVGDPPASLWVNCGLARPVECRSERLERRRWSIGDTVAVRLAESAGETRLLPLAPPPPQDGEVRRAKLGRTDRFPWLTLRVYGIGTDCYPKDGSDKEVAARYRWDPDIARAFRPDEADAPPENVLARWHAGLRRWIPLDAGLPELAVAAGAAGPRKVTPVRLVHAGAATERSGFGAARRFVTAPGHAYVLGPAAWDPEDWSRLEEACLADPHGLVVHAEFRDEESRLHLAPHQPFDHRNALWLSMFDRATGAAKDAEDEDQDQTTHQEAFLRTDASGRPQWQISVPEIEGFPRSVTATFTDGVGHRTHLLCSIESWGDVEARKAEASVQPFQERGITEEKPTPDHFAELARLSENKVVELAWAERRATGGQNPATTTDGLRGLITTDSLTLTGAFPALSGTARRWAVVVSDSVGPVPPAQRRADATMLPAEELTEHCTAPADADLLLDRSTLSGMVVARIKGPGAGHFSHLRVWLHLGRRIVPAMLPAGCFDSDTPSVGDHLTGTLTAGGWLFQVRRRRLHLQALWEWAARPGAGWKQVGQLRGTEADPRFVFQHPRLAQLAEGPGSGEPEPAGRANVRRADNWYRGNTVRVVVQHGSSHLVGTVTGVELGREFQPVHLEQTVLDVWDIGDEARRRGADLPDASSVVRVSREFDISPATRARRTSAPAAQPPHDPVAEWHRLMSVPGQAFTGSLSGEGRLLLRTCRAPDAQGVFQPWLDLVDEPRALVAGRNHSTDRVRVLPVPHGSGYRASFVRAPALTVAEFMAEIAPYASADGHRQVFRTERSTRSKPYYVGVEETGSGIAHRFEFGYGWFVDIPAEALTVGGERVDPEGLTLFHGDCVEAMAFTADESDEVPGGIAVSIALADIRQGVERQIHREATRSRVVHLLEVTVDRERQRVTVVRALTRSRELAPGQEDSHAEEQSVSARLDESDVRALLAAHDGGSPRRLILGRLRPEPEGRRRRALCFAAVLPRAAADGESALRKGDRLYLEAGLIVERANNHLLSFALPPQLRQDDEPFGVLVSRRYFSHRESCLRRAAKTLGLGAYEGSARMLVQLGEPGQGAGANQWQGSTKSPPPRGTATLRSYLARRTEGCFGVVDGRGLHVELRPGVLFSMAGLTGGEGIAPGSVVRLNRGGVGGVTVHQAIPADSTYLDDLPRPMIVFPKDRLRWAKDIGKADADGCFTVAGLPGLSATARRGSGAALLRTRHPKIAGVVRRTRPNGTVEAFLVPVPDPLAGTIAFDRDDVAAGVRILRSGGRTGPDGATAEHAAAWAQLSFMDGSAQQIATACRTWSWRYHDSSTRTWPTDGGEPEPTWVGSPAVSVTEPVFFSETPLGWSLRYELSALRRRGLPATELLEETFQDRPGDPRTQWVVARAERDSVWLELAPGRVTEVRGELVRFSDGHPLADLDWSLLGPGDLLHGRVEGGVNECGHLVLEDWRPGLRGAFVPTRPGGRGDRPRRILMPVSRADEVNGALHLGEGEASLSYPAERTLLARYAPQSRVWLDETNALTAVDNSPVTRDDVVLLRADGTRAGLRIAGLPEARVELAAPSPRLWFRAGWLRDDLSAGSSAVLGAVGAMPVTVEEVTEGPEPVITVSRRLQPSGDWPQGTVLARPVVHLGNGQVVIRMGSALVRVHVERLLPGLPAEAAAATADALVLARTLLRLHWEAATKTLTSGLPGDRATQGETVVRALLAVNSPDGQCLGILCQDTQTQGLCWLPAPDAAWATGAPGDLLVGHLRKARRLTVLRRGRCTVSLIHHPLIAREYENLSPGQSLRVAVVGELDTSPEQPARSTLLVSVEPVGVLAAYTPGDEARPLAEGVMAEVSRLSRVDGRSTLHLVVPGSRRTVLDLPDWLCGSLGELSVPSFADPAGPVDGLVPKEFTRYRAGYRAGRQGAERPEECSAGQALLWALGALERASGVAEVVVAQGTAAAALADWLCSEDGRAAVLQQDRQIDLAPLLAACRLGSLLPQRVSDLAVGWHAFLLLRLGDRAVSSLHTEALVTEWLTRPHRHESDGDWRRLRTVSVAKYLTPAQVTSVDDFARAVMGRPTETESEAAPIARGLRAAVGRLPSAARLHGDAPLLSRLVAVGKSLRPPEGSAVPAWAPLRAQNSEVDAVCRKVLSGGVPLTLLPAFEPLAPASRRYGAVLLQQAEARITREQ
ncbi:hypothetical protein [Streptomyces europaeiscabiei]|uniref:hypothetical protein n=1 Tax=Streptomyces europaeiscabiei TaxID=146819 RepID=UPI0029B4B5CB|nr:hypothetical protein [Streptomyces europaeiscabiei]MDX3776015.1 hypothetical protein [Streptomyces europaeiscabiei]